MATLLSKIWSGALEAAAPPFGLSEWLLRRAYPEVRVNPEVDRELWCASYVQTYLERDVRQVFNVGDLAGRYHEPAIMMADIPAPIGVSPGIRAVPWWWI